MKNIPFGVKIISSLLIISGIGAIIGSIILLTPLFEIIVIYINNFLLLLSIPLDVHAIYISAIPFLFIYCIIFSGLGIFSIIVSIGLLQLKTWAYRLSTIISIPAVAIIIGIVMIWFLTQDEVKNSFDL